MNMTTQLTRPKGVNGHRLLKTALLEFWRKFGGKKSKGAGFSRAEKLAALVEWSGVVIPYYKQLSLRTRRAEFDEAKASLHSMKRFGRCFACGSSATCRHHIVQLQNGGINSKKNIVSLCDPCHAEIHPWLKVLLTRT